MDIDTRNGLWGPQELARFLRVSVNTIYSWRHRGLGPPAVKAGKHLRWNPRDVAKWLERESALERQA
jgi:excisionase family DNA binding protein